ncbi:MAG: DNA-3-methyladenine glycosylase I, partial [Verrucomicrobia bacterium]|nr:DNA-3-methyladenine glycosylase I [Verrucomicrobiota bacterium]
MALKRCPWSGQDPLYLAYHDEEWGVPLHEDNRLFEMLVLETMQSGLSWITILRKREAFQTAFCQFEPSKVAMFGSKEIQELLANTGIIRNRAKLEAAVANARATLAAKEKYGSLDAFLWRVVDGKPLVHRWSDYHHAPAKTPESELLAKECKGHGFRFIGPTVAYAFMQAVGMVNDHEVTCFRHKQLAGGRRQNSGVRSQE